MGVSVRFIGSGDSFGSGGRFQTCILVDGMGCRFLFDCGASSLIAMRAQGIDPNTVDAVLLTHLHGDHCAGVAFLLMDAMLGSKRQTSLVVAGPPGSKVHLARLQESLFPGSAVMTPTFPVHYVELKPGSQSVAGLLVTPYAALHTPETHPSILRVQHDDKVVVYTGDTDWTDALIEASAGADLLISECYFYEKPIKMHMNYATFQKQRHRLGAKRVVLTHLSADMLKHLTDVTEDCAHDGMVINV
jgi:ribonuclease BN (tRNA processing enzyme)